MVYSAGFGFNPAHAQADNTRTQLRAVCFTKFLTSSTSTTVAAILIRSPLSRLIADPRTTERIFHWPSNFESLRGNKIVDTRSTLATTVTATGETPIPLFYPQA